MKETTDIILGTAGQGDKFRLKIGPVKIRLSIRPLTARQIVEIAGEVAQINEIPEDAAMFATMMRTPDDIKHLAQIITIATGTRWRPIVRRAIMGLPLEDIKRLFMIVHKQSDPTPFFFTTILAKGRMNMTKKQTGE